jgi:SAM-dependent methyltransferase
MKPEVIARLLAINADFYAEFAASFGASRLYPQPGYRQLLTYLPQPCKRVLDVGCGNGRFGKFLVENLPEVQYSGLDANPELLAIAASGIDGHFILQDISQPGYLAGLGEFDLIVCLATLQHLPSRGNRRRALAEMGTHLAKNGRLVLSSWQFMGSQRQRRKVLPWQLVGLRENELEEGDFLVAWNRGGSGYRYVNLITAENIRKLVQLTSAGGDPAGIPDPPLRIIAEYLADGKEGNLNLYSVLERALPDG